MSGWFMIGVMCVVVVGCQGSSGSGSLVTSDAATPGGAGGRDGGGGGTPPASVTCNPGEMLCSGNHLWSCTLSGHDATHIDDCAAEGTATNPATCVASACPGGGHACCTRADEPCAYSVTSPVATAGTCSPPLVTLNTSCGSMFFSAVTTPAPAANVCSSDVFEVIVLIDRAKHAAGATFSLGAGDVVIYSATTMGVTTSCTTWMGNVHWISDIPTWRVDMDLTCTTSVIHLVGTFHGTL